jgi:glycine/D-amino acid oxidase-like deaminating enzyme
MAPHEHKAEQWRVMTKYGRSPWVDRFPKSRAPAYPPHRGHLDTDIAIVGGGLTGCATAHALAASGIKAVLVEGSQIGRGSTGASAGWIAEDPGVSFLDLEKALGLRAARSAFQTWRRSALDLAALLRRLNVRCHLETQATITAAETPEQAARLKREQQARRNAGLDAPWVDPRAIKSETGLIARAGLRGKDSATLDPVRACAGLAAAAAARGAQLFERSPAKKIKFGTKAVEVTTAGGTIRAQRIVIATGRPTPLFKSLVRHFWFRSSYLALTEPVPAKIRRQLGTGASIVRDSADPPHVVRWVDDERLLVMGADGESPPERLRGKVDVQRTGQLMYELSTLYPEISGILPAYGWDAPYARTADGLPYIGPHRNYPRHLFAFGDASHSVTGAYLASRILLRHCLDERDPADDLFGFR